ncbi:MAG: glucose-6-phosphate isomerase [Saccharofermentanales bacterium]|nr:glucose-6-phosphate isomerase [Clostridiaceae bacterium]
MLKFDASNACSFVSEEEIDQIRPQLQLAHKMLMQKTGPGSDFLGWLELPRLYDRDEFARIRKAAAYIRKNADILVVIGIGGSYLGARAAIEMLTHSFNAALGKRNRKHPMVVFAGNNISSTYLADLFDLLENHQVAVNVISKSGTTTEPAIVFRIFKAWMEERYGREGARQRIFVTTDRIRGALKMLADREGYETFVIPDDIGGRYSVLTPVGLLPIAAAGIDIQAMMRGARHGMQAYRTVDPEQNPCYAYAAWRNILLRKGYQIEIMANYEPGLHYFTEWWKQLYGESEGKDGRGVFPAGVDNTADLHSMGQYIQDGSRILFETVLLVEKARREVIIPNDPADTDGLNFLAGLDMQTVNHKACQGTVLAHLDGGVPNLQITIPEMSAYYFGQLVYFFEKACAISGYLLAVNPFNQPGVEDYKTNMFALLGKPGFEQRRAELEARLNRGD